MTSPSDSTAELLDTRKDVHGQFRDNATSTILCLEALQQCPRWNELTPVTKVAIFLILQKLSRACSGDPKHLDHWQDIQGYARLVENEIKTSPQYVA
jgi:hypothetical protein